MKCLHDYVQRGITHICLINLHQKCALHIYTSCSYSYVKFHINRKRNVEEVRCTTAHGPRQTE